MRGAALGSIDAAIDELIGRLWSRRAAVAAGNSSKRHEHGRSVQAFRLQCRETKRFIAERV
jgi:hypothetical protein